MLDRCWMCPLSTHPHQGGWRGWYQRADLTQQETSICKAREMGRACGPHPGKSLGFIPRLAGASFPGPSAHVSSAGEHLDFRAPWRSRSHHSHSQGSSQSDYCKARRILILGATSFPTARLVTAQGPGPMERVGWGGIGPSASERPSRPESWRSQLQGFSKICRRQQPGTAGEPAVDQVRSGPRLSTCLAWGHWVEKQMRGAGHWPKTQFATALPCLSFRFKD